MTHATVIRLRDEAHGERLNAKRLYYARALDSHENALMVRVLDWLLMDGALNYEFMRSCCSGSLAFSGPVFDRVWDRVAGWCANPESIR